MLACLLVCLFACLFVCLLVCLFVCLFACLLVCLFACLPCLLDCLVTVSNIAFMGAHGWHNRHSLYWYTIVGNDEKSRAEEAPRYREGFYSAHATSMASPQRLWQRVKNWQRLCPARQKEACCCAPYLLMSFYRHLYAILINYSHVPRQVPAVRCQKIPAVRIWPAKIDGRSAIRWQSGPELYFDGRFWLHLLERYQIHGRSWTWHPMTMRAN